MKKWKARIKESLTDLPQFVLAWITQVMAFLGGAFAVATFLGDWLDTALGWIPWEWVPVALLFAITMGVLLDLLWDALPERIALWGAFAAPSVAAAVPGNLGDSVQGWADDLKGALRDGLTEWFGDQPAIGLTVICLIGVVLGAKYALPKKALSKKTAGA